MAGDERLSFYILKTNRKTSESIKEMETLLWIMY